MVVVCLFLGVLLNLETSTLFEFCHKFCDGAQPSVLKSRNEWHSSWRVLVAGAVLRKLVTSVITVVVAVTQTVLFHTQPVVAVPLTPRARELAWTTNNTFIVTPFAFLPIYIHLHGHLQSPSSFPLTSIVSSIHLGRFFHSLWSSFPLTLIVVSVHLDRHFHSPGSSVTFTFIVISIHLDRLHHSPWSSFITHLDRHFHSP